MTSREEFLKKLKSTFKIEATEVLAKVTSSLIELEKTTDEEAKAVLTEILFREAHSLKGAARAVNASEIEAVCQSMEGVFSGLKSKELKLFRGMFDVFHTAVDLISQLLAETEEHPDYKLREGLPLLLSHLLELASGETSIEIRSNPAQAVPVKSFKAVEPAPTPPEEQAATAKQTETEPKTMPHPVNAGTDSTIRISTKKMDDLFYQVEEMLLLKQVFVHLDERLHDTVRQLDAWSHEAANVLSAVKGIRQQTEQSQQHFTIDRNELERIFDYLESADAVLGSMRAGLTALRKQTVTENYSAQIKVESLLDHVKEIISVPFSTILDVFPKAARDISRNIGKEVVVEITGSETEIDRRILEELRNPLMHLLRNSIDHGIEMPGVRKQKNKSETGTVWIAVDRFENNHAAIRISDDGAGINFKKVRQKYAAQKQLPLSEVDAVDELTLTDFIFSSGVSTTEMITDLSGRGLGLAIVKEKIEQLGGSISVRSDENKGAEFLIEVPLSLVTIRGVHIKEGDREFVVPASRIEKVIQIEKSDIKTIGKKSGIPYREGIIPLVYLSDILEIPFRNKENRTLTVVVMGSSDQLIGFALDEVIGEDLVMSKKFNSQLKRVRNIAGATVLGSGRVVPILHVQDLIKSAVKESRRRPVDKGTGEVREIRSILVVEDSITSRMLLKNILETAGYKVFTAVDGVDGYTSLKSNPTDLVISDVDMPRMSGLDMTAKIRSDSAIASIPVILVTSLSRREDRERGLEVGANAYIVKSNFDQSNLLEVVSRLIG